MSDNLIGGDNITVGHITFKASDRAIRRAVDSGISRNPTSYMLYPGLAIPAEIQNAWTDSASPMPATTKRLHPTPPMHAFYRRMKKNMRQASHRLRITDYATAATEQMELYCADHPGSPSAVRRPRLFVRSELWVALLGPSLEEGIVGIGATVAAALRAFDAQYLAGLRPPIAVVGYVGAPDEPLKKFGTTRRRSRNRKSNLKSSAEVSGFTWPA